MPLQVGIDFQTMRNLFFDREKIRNTVDARTRKVLSKFGAHVRQTSRKSIKNSSRKSRAKEPGNKKRKKRKDALRHSRPGSPPFNQTGVLKNFIFFAYEPDSRSVIIGPAFVPGRTGATPSVLEHGGRTKLKGGQTANIDARPYMGPAFEKELPSLPAMWKGVIK